MRIENDIKLDYSDVLLRPKRSTMGSRSEVNLSRQYKFRNSQQYYSGVPIVASNMDGVGTYDMAKALFQHKSLTCLVKSHPYKDRQFEAVKKYGASVSTGISSDDMEKLKQWQYEHEVNGLEIPFLTIDVANGYSEFFINKVSEVREMFPKTTLIAGNVVTPDITEELILRGADVVKVGIGPGSVCTTRIKTGVGFPQLSAVMECADAAHGLGGHIMADGGCATPGDVVKAFAAGADFVMLGGMLAGHDEGGGEIDPDTGKIHFYGMSSKEAQGDAFKDYRSSEGRLVEVPYRGTVHNTVLDILGGVRSACTYTGAIGLKQLTKCATFVRVNNQYNRVYEASTIGD